MNLRLDQSSKKIRVFNFLSAMDKEFIPPLQHKVNLDDYSLKLADSAVNFFLVQRDVDIAHAAFYCNDYKDYIAFISLIGIMPEFQGSGAADHLLRSVIEECVDKQMNFLRLEVDVRNLKAIRFYEKNGFEYISLNLMQKDIRC